MCVSDASFTAARQMFDGWPKETGGLESSGRRRYLPGELSLNVCVFEMRCLNAIINLRCPVQCVYRGVPATDK